jgi:DNA polymerase-4
VLWVVHVDMDAYFASVEQRRDPSLRGKPVIVGGLPGTRSTVSTASYEARAYGVKSGMSVAEAYRRCPHGVFMPGNSALYLDTSRHIFRELETFSPRVEPASVDEAYVEVEAADPLDLGRRMQSHLDSTVGLSASLGISDSKYLAKVCSSFAKPHGLTVMRRSDVESMLWSRPVDVLYGVGARTTERLQRLGLRTVGEVATAPPGVLERALGAHGESLRRKARGQDRWRVTPPDEAPDAKSIGHEHTLEHDLHDRAEVETMLRYLCGKVGRRARKYGVAGRRVVLKLRDPTFHTISHGRIVPRPLDADDDLARVAYELLGETRFWERGVRLAGVTLELLAPSGAQLAFEFDPRPGRAQAARDRINDKYGDRAVAPARTLDTAQRAPHISFTLPR